MKIENKGSGGIAHFYSEAAARSVRHRDMKVAHRRRIGGGGVKIRNIQAAKRKIGILSNPTGGSEAAGYEITDLLYAAMKISCGGIIKISPGGGAALTVCVADVAAREAAII